MSFANNFVNNMDRVKFTLLNQWLESGIDLLLDKRQITKDSRVELYRNARTNKIVCEVLYEPKGRGIIYYEH